ERRQVESLLSRSDRLHEPVQRHPPNQQQSVEYWHDGVRHLVSGCDREGRNLQLSAHARPDRQPLHGNDRSGLHRKLRRPMYLLTISAMIRRNRGLWGQSLSEGMESHPPPSLGGVLSEWS